MKKTLWFFISRGLFILSAIVLILYARGWEYDFETGEVIRTGILDVNSYPSGSNVFLGSEANNETPTSIHHLSPGRYQLTVAKTGYHSFQSFETITPEHVTQIHDIRLFPTNPKISLITKITGEVIPISQNQFVNFYIKNTSLVGVFYDSSGRSTFEKTFPLTSLPKNISVISDPESELIVFAFRDEENTILNISLLSLKSFESKPINLEEIPSLAPYINFLVLKNLFLGKSQLFIETPTKILEYNPDSESLETKEKTETFTILSHLDQNGFFESDKFLCFDTKTNQLTLRSNNLQEIFFETQIDFPLTRENTLISSEKNNVVFWNKSNIITLTNLQSNNPQIQKLDESYTPIKWGNNTPDLLLKSNKDDEIAVKLNNSKTINSLTTQNDIDPLSVHFAEEYPYLYTIGKNTNLSVSAIRIPNNDEISLFDGKSLTTETKSIKILAVNKDTMIVMTTNNHDEHSVYQVSLI